MADRNVDGRSLEFWAPLMGRELPQAKQQPRQPVLIENGKFKLSDWAPNACFEEGVEVGFVRRGNRVLLAEVPGGHPVRREHVHEEDHGVEYSLPDDARELLGDVEPIRAMLLHWGDELELASIRVEEHGPDVLGPRIIDEVQASPDASAPPAVVRHVVLGFEYDAWTCERLAELEDLLCAEPFAHDPLAAIAEGDDWVGWKTRSEILRQPADGDEELRGRLAGEVFANQAGDGSWDHSPLKTAYIILRARSLDVPADDVRVQRAATWLLDAPQPVGRPGMWMLSEEHLAEWNAVKSGEKQSEQGQYFPNTVGGADSAFARAEEQQRVVPSLARHYTGVCDTMLHTSATACDALCRCGHAGHPRVKAYANSMLQLGGMFGYFCACWGIVTFGREIDDLNGADPDFDQRTDEQPIALKAVPYGYGRDGEDLKVLARKPRYAGVHRPDLADTNGWWTYEGLDIGIENHYALVGSYWENADCWAKTNRALSQLPGWPGTIAEFFSLFQARLYQTCLGTWEQGFPASILRWLAEVTRTARATRRLEDSAAMRFAKAILLRTVPWLRQNQRDDGLWHHEELPRWSGGKGYPPPSPRLMTYHIASALNTFGLLDRLRPGA